MADCKLHSEIRPVLPKVLLVMVFVTPLKSSLGQEETLVASGRWSYNMGPVLPPGSFYLTGRSTRL